MTFGARLAAAREAKGLSQTELGKGLNTRGEDASKAVVSGWENDHHFPRVDQLMLICNKLGVGADFLLFGEAVSSRYLAAEAAAEKLTPDERAALLERLSDGEKGYDQGAVERSRVKTHNQPSSPKRKRA